MIDIGNHDLLLDVQALRAVAAVLGVRHRIKVTFSRSLPGKVGEYTTATDGAHQIRILDGRSPEDTTVTLVHELTHAAQAERPGGIEQQMRTPGRQAIEAEAERTAAVYAGATRLVRRATAADRANHAWTGWWA